jgi:hypothetical protein
VVFIKGSACAGWIALACPVAGWSARRPHMRRPPRIGTSLEVPGETSEQLGWNADSLAGCPNRHP